MYICLLICINNNIYCQMAMAWLRWLRCSFYLNVFSVKKHNNLVWICCSLVIRFDSSKHSIHSVHFSFLLFYLPVLWYFRFIVFPLWSSEVRVDYRADAFRDSVLSGHFSRMFANTEAWAQLVTLKDSHFNYSATHKYGKSHWILFYPQFETVIALKRH